MGIGISSSSRPRQLPLISPRPSTSETPTTSSSSGTKKYAPLNHTHKEADITNLNKYSKEQLYTKTQIDALLSAFKEGIRWQPQTFDVIASSNVGYVANHAVSGTRLEITAPSTAPIGTKFAVTTGENTGGWKVSTPTGVEIFYGGSGTSNGGYIQSEDVDSSAEFVCIISDTKWNVVSSQGILSVN